jgi:nicotinate dehydrogenase subunit B
VGNAQPPVPLDCGPGGGLCDGEAALDPSVEARPGVPYREEGDFSTGGGDFPRVDISLKVTGAPVHLQDIRLENMLHARVVRPQGARAEPVALDAGPVKAMEGVVAVVHNGKILDVVAEGEFQTVRAMRAAVMSRARRGRTSFWPRTSRPT